MGSSPSKSQKSANTREPETLIKNKHVESNNKNDQQTEGKHSNRRASILVNGTQHSQRPRTSKERIRIQREKTLTDKPHKKEKSTGFKREKTMGFKREKTMANITREKTILGKGRRKLVKTVSQSYVSVSKTIDPILVGNLSADCPSTAKIIRIFTSSTFKDTELERNKWMTEAYPKIKLFCQKLGYEFQVVDMRWGLRDEVKDEHTTTELCLWEIKQCQRLSTGPNFVTLLSHRYGNRSLTRVIDAAEFETLLGAIEEKEIKTLLLKWFRRDDNAVPPIYTLTQISKLLPDFLSTDSEKKSAANNQWWEESDIMQEALEAAANKVLGAEEARKYIISVTEKEIQMGVLEADDPTSHCLWLKRNITNIENQEPSKILARYIECTGPEDKVQKARTLSKELSEKRLPKVLTSENILSYEVPWDEGMNTTNPKHKAYFKKMTEDFTDRMCSMIDKAVEERKRSQKSDPLYEEVLQHVTFCKSKCENFQGREETLARIKQYLLGDSNSILAVHGSSGSGKTSLMAKTVELANLLPKSTKKPVATVLRFVGTTPGSSNISALLESLTKQIKFIYGQDLQVSEELRELVEQFEHVLQYASETLPLVVMIDSLDQLDPSNNARNLFWLPTRLPPYVKFVVSSLEEEKYECFPNLKVFLPEENLIAVPKLPSEDVSGIVNHWLKNKNRQLTEGQMQLLLNVFEKCPIPLFLKLSFDEACRWASYSPVSETILQKTVRDSINSLFSRLEVSHGELLVSRALGYLTAAKIGLSESELEDILSCDDDVLNDVYMYWTPPVRRLPPLLMVRIRTDLQQYLVERGADGVIVTSWYHRQFIEAAESRYCQPDKLQFLHIQLADFFDGRWADGRKKPYKDKHGKSCEEDRHVMSQPIMYGETFNIRKLNNLPYHRIHAGDLKLLREKCLCNYEFLQNKLIATSTRGVIDDFELARRIYPNQPDIDLIGDAMYLSEDDVIYDPLMFPSQMLDRLSGEKVLKDFLRQCEQCTHAHIRPNQEVLLKPGGQLRYAMPGHKGPLKSMDLKKNGKTAVSCCENGDDEIRTWDVQNGKILRSYEGIGTDPDYVKFVNDDKYILINFMGLIKAINELGDVMFDIHPTSTQYQLGVGGAGNIWLALFENKEIELFSTLTGERKHTVVNDSLGSLRYGLDSHVSGSNNYFVVTDTTQQYLSVFSIKSKSFICTKRVFTEDVDTEEMLTVDALVISADEKRVMYCDCYTNDLQQCDINTLKHIKVFKGSEYDYTLNYHVSSDGNYLYCPSNRDVVVWNLKTGEKKYKLQQHSCNVTDVKTVDFKTMVSITEDTLVYIWDMTRPEKRGNMDKYTVGQNVWDIITLPNSRYVAGLYKKTDDNTNDFGLIVYDLAEMKIVRQANLIETPGVFELIDDKHVLLSMGSQKLKIVNLDTMKVVQTFQGKIAKKDAHAHVIMNYSKIVVQTQGLLRLKVYDIDNENTEEILESPVSNEKIVAVHTNEKSSKVAVKTDYGKVIVYDISNKSSKVITAQTLKVEELCDAIAVQPTGDNVVVTGKISMKIEGEQCTEVLAYIWNFAKGQTLTQLYDKECHERYITKENRRGLSISVDCIMFITDKQFITSDDDFIMRVWDINSGSLIKRLTGHSSNIEMFNVMDGPLFVSYGCWEEENALKLWMIDTLECVASFKLDSTIAKLRLCKDGLTFVTTTMNPSRIIHWKLHGVDEIVDLSKKQKTFGGQDLVVDLDLQTEEDYDEDPQDPDTDLELEYDSDADDDDDDDYTY